MRVLTVDDSRMVRRIPVGIAKAIGFDLAEAGAGPRAPARVDRREERG